MFAPIPSKETIETFDYPIDVLLQNSNNTDVGGVVVEQILGDFTLEHKYKFFQLKTNKNGDIQYYCSFLSLNWKNVDEFMKHKCTDGKVHS